MINYHFEVQFTLSFMPAQHTLMIKQRFKILFLFYVLTFMPRSNQISMFSTLMRTVLLIV